MKQFNYSQIKPGYYDDVFHLRKGVQSRWHHKKFSAVEDLLPSSGSHLDVGCGPGTFIGNIASKKSIKSLGIDIAPSQIEFANRSYSSETKVFEVRDLFALDPCDAKYDIITFIEVLEHLPGYQALRMLEHAKKLLNQGGKIVITTPNYGSAWPLVEKVVNLFGAVKYEDQHINRYTINSLREDIVRSGFTLFDITSFMSFSPFLAAVNWRLSTALSRADSYTGRTTPLGMLLLAVIHK